MFCPKCGKSNDDAARFCQSCGNELGLVQKATATQYAGFWNRAAAMIVDALIVGALSGILTAVTVGVGVVAIFFLPWIYEAYMLSSDKQATVGKIMMGMLVTDLNGGRISFGRATGRHFAKWISLLMLGFGFLMAAFTDKKQALHDMIADTLVVTKQA